MRTAPGRRYETESLFLALCGGLLCSAQAFAQQHYTEGGVTRVVLLAVVPGKLDTFLGDLNQHLTPIWQGEKQQGLITDYQVELNTTKDSPEDW